MHTIGRHSLRKATLEINGSVIIDTCERPEPPIIGAEKEVLSGFLEFLRGTILCKRGGLSDEELRRPHDPSGLALLGMVKHLAAGERTWFRIRFNGEGLEDPRNPHDPAQYWRIAPEETTEAIVDFYNEEVAAARHIVASADLDTLAKVPPDAMRGMQLRWIVNHMIEETARHCGHADLIREAIDGQTGE